VGVAERAIQAAGGKRQNERYGRGDDDRGANRRRWTGDGGKHARIVPVRGIGASSLAATCSDHLYAARQPRVLSFSDRLDYTGIRFLVESLRSGFRAGFWANGGIEAWSVAALVGAAQTGCQSIGRGCARRSSPSFYRAARRSLSVDSRCA